MAITKETLLEFGMVEVAGDEKFLTPMKKVLGSNKEGDLSIVVWMGRNSAELGILSPDGALTYINGIETIDELKIIEKAITEWEPPY